MNITIKNFQDASEQGMPWRLKYQFAKEDLFQPSRHALF
jgi:hypothetical protein